MMASNLDKIESEHLEILLSAYNVDLIGRLVCGFLNTKVGQIKCGVTLILLTIKSKYEKPYIELKPQNRYMGFYTTISFINYTIWAHLLLKNTGGWDVVKGGSEKAPKHFETRQPAVDYARVLAKKL